jgi:hypothetical protein
MWELDFFSSPRLSPERLREKRGRRVDEDEGRIEGGGKKEKGRREREIGRVRL